MDKATLSALLEAIATANNHPAPKEWAESAASAFTALTTPAPAATTPAETPATP